MSRLEDVVDEAVVPLLEKLVEAGVPIDRIPTQTQFISAIIGCGLLDQEKLDSWMKQWVVLMAREEIMKHAREDYNRFQDPEHKIPEDEPVFLIRAQDVVSGAIVRAWAEFNDIAGGDPEASRLARAHAIKMDEWPKKKLADIPR